MIAVQKAELVESQLPISIANTKHKSPITNHQSPITIHKSQITNIHPVSKLLWPR
jgi:hypothetical protein